MESLLPSEIARLVYGYLIDEKCEAAAQLFLETSEFLKECNIAQKKGRKFNTRVMGLCLVDILNLYTDAVCMLKNCKDKSDLSNTESNNVIKELQNVLFVDELSDKNASKTVFLRISIPPKRKSSGSPEKLGRKENEEKVVESKEPEKKKEESNAESSLTGNQGKLSATNLDDFDLNMLQTLLDNTALHERLAENINKAIDSSGEIKNPKTDEKKIIETVLHSTEADPIFDELLHMLVAPRAEDTTTPEDTDKENGDPTEDRTDLVGHPSTKEEETIKRLEAESNLAIEGILAGNKKVQQETSVAQPSPSNLIPIDKSQIPPHLLAGIKEVSSIPASPVTSTAMVIPLSSSTPLQPIDSSNIPVISFLPPGQPVRVLQKVATVGTRGGLQPRRRRIIPKPDPATLPSVIHVQVQNQDFNQDLIEAVPVQSVPEVLKKPVARTRGGRSRGSRGVRSITPQISKLNDDKINIVFVDSKTSGIKTRSVYKRQQKCTSLKIKNQIDSEQTEAPPSETTDQQNKLSNVPSETSNLVETLQKSEVHQKPLSAQLPEEKELSPTSAEDHLEKVAEDQQNAVLNEAQSPEKQSLPATEIDINNEEPDPNQESSGNSKDQQTTNNAPLSTNTIPPSSSNVVSQSCLDAVSQTTSNILPQTSTTVSTLNSVDIEPSTSDVRPGTSEGLSKPAAEKKEMCDDGTPEQQPVVSKLKQRVSLSTPRRGSHIRVLEFKTPDKNNLEVRKSLTSPKVYAKSKQLDKLDNVKRGIFKSPEQKKDLEKKRNWDSDLRKYFSSAAMDIPSSVGLKRKNGSKKDTKTRKKGGKSAKQNDVEETDKQSPTKPPSLCSSNEDLVKQIEKEVRDVIGDEELSLNHSGNSDKQLQSVGNSSPDHNSSGSDMEIEEIDKERVNIATTLSATDPKDINKEDLIDKPPNEHSPRTSPEVDKDLPTPLMTSSPVKENSSEMGENVPLTVRPPQKIENKRSCPDLKNSENTKTCNSEKQASETESSHSFSALDQQLFSTTPLKLSMSPSTDNSVGEITPTTKLLMSHLGSSITSPVLSPIAHSYSNLESILITEGTRLEQEKALLVADGITKLSDNVDEPKSTPENSLSNVQAVEGNEVSNSLENNEKSSSSENHNERNVSIFQTPAKPSSDYVPPGIPVEMTPLTKVLHSETKILSTALVTPTLPATPKPPPHQEKSPNRNESLHELPKETPCKETFVNKEERGSQKEDNSKGESMPLIENNQKKQLKQTLIKTVTESPAQSKIINSGKQECTPLPLKSTVKKSDFLTTPATGPGKKETIKLCKTPRIQLLPKIPSDYFTPKQKLQKKKSKLNESSSVSSASAKGIFKEGINSENKLDEAMDMENGSNIEGVGLSTKKTDGLKTSTPKGKRVKPSPMVELNSTRKRRGTSLQKSPPGKKSSKFQLDLMKKEEQVLRECLQNAKAILFGINSSDSDSSDECVSKEANISVASSKSKRNSSTSSVKEQESVKPQLFTARDRLKKLESVSMLESSDSSDDSLIVPPSSRSCPGKAEEKKTVGTILNQTSAHHLQSLQASNERCRSRSDYSITSDIRKVGSPKKSEKTQPVSDNSKVPSNVRDKDESCESFPALYLSEESNMSIVSESHNMKFRKSPSAGSDLLSKKATHFLAPNSPLVRTDAEKQYFKPSDDNCYASSSKVTPQTLPGNYIRAADAVVKKTVKGLDAYETVIHQTPSKPTVLSNQERQAFSEFLNNYTYSFTLDADGREDLLCKTLRTSPFYTIFELNSKDASHSEHRKKIPERIPRVEKGNSPPPHERPRKRHRSGSSDDEHRKFRRFHSNPRRDYRGKRPRPPPFRRRDFSSDRPRPFSSPRYQNSPHYRPHSYSFDRKRPRRDSMETNGSGQRDEKWPHKKPSNEKSDISPHSSKPAHFSHYSIKDKSFNESFRSSKSSESDRLLVDQSFRSSESPRCPSDHVNTPLSERTHINFVKSKKEILQYVRKEEKEDGELSDSSGLQPLKSSAQLAAAAAEAKRKELIALVTDKSRASLLKKIDLDEFLTLLHGEEEK